MDPLVQKVMSAPDKMLLSVSKVFDYQYQDQPHSFDGFVCEECGEMVVESYGRVRGDKKLCQDCYVKLTQ